MRITTHIITSVAAFGLLGLVGCDVKKVADGNVQAPKYEVTKTQEGEVKLPKYDVTAPEVNVSKKEVEVSVPKVVTEKETVAVPNIDIKSGKEKAQEQGK